jgi:CMP/dCMP kinase
MGIITVSRAFGAGGSFFAQELARALEYEYFDKQSVQKICTEKKDNVCAFGMEDEKADSFFHKIADLMENRSFYKLNLMANIYDYALKNNVVFTGMGANVILAGAADVLNIQVVMPLSERIKAVASHLSISVNNALEIVRKRDDEKREFFKYFFDRDINDPTLYHLVINFSRISHEDGIEMVVSYCKKHFAPGLSPEAEVFLKNRLLEKRAELLLHRLGIAHNYAKVLFEVKEEGILIVKGVIGGEHEKKELFDALKMMIEIKNTEDHVKVGTLSHLIY